MHAAPYFERSIADDEHVDVAVTPGFASCDGTKQYDRMNVVPEFSNQTLQESVYYGLVFRGYRHVASMSLSLPFALTPGRRLPLPPCAPHP